MIARYTSRAWLVPGIVLFGLFLRTFHYLRCPPVWHDEAALLINVLHLDFDQMFGKLIWHEAAPPLFLCIERAALLIFGDDIQVLRCFPFLASCLSLLLLVPVARAVLPTAGVPWALLLFACGDKLAWHACEAKPYAVDVLVAVLLLYLFCAANLSLRVRLTLYLLLAPILIFLSFPACFLYGGVLLALLPAVRREGRWLCYGGVALAVGVSFLFLALGPARAQKDGAMLSCWLDFFPDWSRPWSVPGWILISTGEVYRYCLPPLGQVLGLSALVGMIGLWRQGRRELVVAIVVPGVLALGAAGIGSYPYGGARVMVYVAPALALLVAAGVAPILCWLRERGRPLVAVAVLLLLLPFGESLGRLMRPWKRAQTDAACAWVLERRDANDLVLGNDWTCSYYLRRLGERFQPAAEVPNAEPPRTWVVYVGKKSAAQRLEEARARAPAGWQVVEHRDFHDATVVLLQE
jgi:hypothetical protein